MAHTADWTLGKEKISKLESKSAKTTPKGAKRERKIQQIIVDKLKDLDFRLMGVSEEVIRDMEGG